MEILHRKRFHTCVLTLFQTIFPTEIEFANHIAFVQQQLQLFTFNASSKAPLFPVWATGGRELFPQVQRLGPRCAPYPYITDRLLPVAGAPAGQGGRLSLGTTWAAG